MSKLRTFWFRHVRLRDLDTWKSWSGFGVVLSWPEDGWENEAKNVYRRLQYNLPKSWMIAGPEFAAGGVIVMYAWPRNEPRVREGLTRGLLETTPEIFNKLVEEIKGVKIFVGGAEVERGAFKEHILSEVRKILNEEGKK